MARTRKQQDADQIFMPLTLSAHVHDQLWRCLDVSRYESPLTSAWTHPAYWILLTALNIFVCGTRRTGVLFPGLFQSTHTRTHTHTHTHTNAQADTETSRQGKRPPDNLSPTPTQPHHHYFKFIYNHSSWEHSNHRSCFKHDVYDQGCQSHRLLASDLF